MRNAKIWLKAEDQTLKEIVLKKQLSYQTKKSWSSISTELNSIVKTSNKSAKQCRERQKVIQKRWNNQLNPTIKLDLDWSQQQEKLLFQLHQKQGNRWADISKSFPGRTDNSVKNHYYSTIRRGLRRLNKYIITYKRKFGCFKEFKQDLLNKIMMVLDNKIHSKLDIKDEKNAIQLSDKIKHQLRVISNENDQPAHFSSDRKEILIKDLQQFSKLCKHKKGHKTNISLNIKKQSQIQQKDQLSSSVCLNKLQSLPCHYKNSIYDKEKKNSVKMISHISNYQRPQNTGFLHYPNHRESMMPELSNNQLHPNNSLSFLNSIEKVNAKNQITVDDRFEIPPTNIISLANQNILLLQSQCSNFFKSGEYLKFQSHRFQDSQKYQFLLSESIKKSFSEISEKLNEKKQ